MALRPAIRVAQVGKQLAKALLIQADYINKTPAESKAFHNSLTTDFHKHYIKLALKGPIPHSASITKKKSVSAPIEENSKRKTSRLERKSAAAAANNNSPRAAEEGAPSEFDKRLQIFRTKGLPMIFLHTLTNDERDAEGTRGYEYFHIRAKRDDIDGHDQQLISNILSIQEGVPGNERDRLIEEVRRVFIGHLHEEFRKIRIFFREAETTLKDAVGKIKKQLGPIGQSLSIDDLDDTRAITTYMTRDELHKIVVLYARSLYSADVNKPDILRWLVEFLEPIVKRQKLRNNHSKTRKSQYGLTSKSASANINAAEKVYLKKQMTILGNQALTYAQKQSALRRAGEERKAYFAPVPFSGPIVDKRGFIQHSTECSTDAIAQTLLYGVPWFTVLQPLLYTMTIPKFNELYDTMSTCPGPRINREALLQLILHIQERFRIHYTSVKLKKNAEACVPPFDYSLIAPILKRKNRKSAELGPSIKKNVATVVNSSLYSTYTIYVAFILQTMFNFFGINDIRCYHRIITHEYKNNPILFLNNHIQYKNYTHLAFMLQEIPFPLEEVTLKYQTRLRTGHFTAVYKSGDDEWVHYDNESGIMPLHPALMKDLLNETDPRYFVGFMPIKGENGIRANIYYKMEYFNTSNISELNTKTIHKWSEDSWTAVPFTDIPRAASIYVIYELIHIATLSTETPGYKGRFLDDIV